MAAVEPPVVVVAAGSVLHRVHAAARGARFYGRRDATWRWDDPAGGYGVLYLGLTPVGPFAETLLRRPDQRVLLWSEVAKRRFARFRATRPLRLADLHGAGLGWFGIDLARIAASHDGATARPIPAPMPTLRRSPRSSMVVPTSTVSTIARGSTAIISTSRCSIVPIRRSRCSTKGCRSNGSGSKTCYPAGTPDRRSMTTRGRG